MNAKRFSEVFPGINLKEDRLELFDSVLVERVTMDRRKSSFKIYICAPSIIEHAEVKRLEEKLKRHLSPDSEFSFHVCERFELAGSFKPEAIYEIYSSSIAEIVLEEDAACGMLLKSAKVSFGDDGIMYVRAQKNFVYEGCGEKTGRLVEDVFKKKFGTQLKVSVDCSLESSTDFKAERRQRMNESMQNAAKKEDSRQPAGESVTGVETKRQAAGESAADAKTERQPAGRGMPVAVKKADPQQLYGKDFDGDAVPISEITEEMNRIVVRGQVFNVDVHETKSGRFICSLSLTDFTDSIKAKLFLTPEQKDELLGNIRKGDFIAVGASARNDAYEKEITLSSVTGIRKSRDFRDERRDNAAEKRVELHCHTKMSELDGVSDVRAIVRRACEWGHRAVAITDHGVVSAFPDANNEYKALRAQAESRGEAFDFKVIYGVEAYLVDDTKDMIKNPGNLGFDGAYVAFDLETTGFNPNSDRIIEIGAVKIENGRETANFSAFVNPGCPIPFRIEKLTGISDAMVADADDISVVLPEFLKFCDGCALIAHNAEFDESFILANAARLGLSVPETVIDTVTMSRFLVKEIGRFKLNNVAKALGVPLKNHHRAVDDAVCCGEIFLKLCDRAKNLGINNLGELNDAGKASYDVIKRAPAHHAVILARNETGRVNLYRLISKSHIETFSAGHPRILKSDYTALSDGLMIGSACAAGEIYQAILRGAPDEEISRLVSFYDYLEVQPVGNNAFMIRTGVEEIDEKKRFLVDSEDDLRQINRKIVSLGEKFNKPVVATCDVHFLDPGDEIYRRIIQSGNGYNDADSQPPLFLHTTDEMLEEFAYLGAGKAHEIVVENTNMIADMVDAISPIYQGKCPPKIQDSDKTLRSICYKRAHEMYGDPLPEIVSDRLEKELSSIISNGFAVMYIMAQKLVSKSNADGYLVGSRGSVGSSFVATMAGITEVNPLKPHYYCPQCKYSDFDSKEVRAHAGGSGYDLADKDCPVCGARLSKDGFDIPFETFLGFNGDKEPDIDLNFSGEYQSRAHDYTEEMFGKGHTFRAGTITGLADKTAYGYVKNYFEDRGIVKRRCEIERLTIGCTGIRKSTGQHPGGIVIVPSDKEICQFTPVQKPANDMNAKSVTTHFEYHAIDKNLLKLDILGHDDPTMLKKLEEYTGTNAKDIPINDPKVMSLFESPAALGITPDDIGGCPTGSLGVPELGTNFVIGMLKATKPATVADLVRISGLSHGTDVWTGNAQTLIEEGRATISTAICTRDDIMTYLISMGIEPGLAFTIMESVRRGRGVKPEWEEEMLGKGVPDWYIWSCKKIKYMFPKAHAAAYIMMALRIAYYKVYYPVAYYAAYFAIRAKAFNYELMCQGQSRLLGHIREHEEKMKNGEYTAKDEATYRDMQIVREMYARGIEFTPIDIYSAQAHYFKIVDGKIMPSFDSIDGMGETAAANAEEAAKEGRFISKDDFRERCKVSKTIVDAMSRLGLFGDMPEENQLSIFDLM